MQPSGSDHDIPLAIAREHISRQERLAATVAIVTVLFGTLLWTPFANIQLGRIDSFVPTVQTVMCVADLLTAVLLLSQYAVQAHPAILVLASGYISSGLFAFLQTLAFPGAYAPTGLFGDGIDTPAWLFVLWHTSFPLGVCLYALTKNRSDETISLALGNAGRRITLTVVAVVATVALLTWSITAGAAFLFPLYSSSVTQQTLAANYTNVVLGLFYAGALAVLIARRRTILDMWLIVAMCAWIPNFVVAALTTSVRFSLGWYSARICAFVASWTVLVVLLTETTLLYARLANAWTLRRRERADRLMSVDAATAAIAHEVRNPLGAIVMNASTALMIVEAESIDIGELKILLREIDAASHRADDILSSVRAMFRNSGERRTLLDLEDVSRQVLVFLQDDFRLHDIAVEIEFGGRGTHVQADSTQVQQVIMNLVKNAIEAMVGKAGVRRLRIGTSVVKDVIVFFVEDSGGGMPKEDQERVFEAFFTTKATGMGLGLAVCRTLIENHGGVLRIAKSDSEGSIFEVGLPVAAVPTGLP